MVDRGRLSSKVLLNSEWKGHDLMGKLLETVRADLLNPGQTTSPVIPTTTGTQDLDLNEITPLPDDDMPPQVLG